jgi:hypothetical protein
MLGKSTTRCVRPRPFAWRPHTTQPRSAPRRPDRRSPLPPAPPLTLPPSLPHRSPPNRIGSVPISSSLPSPCLSLCQIPDIELVGCALLPSLLFWLAFGSTPYLRPATEWIRRLRQNLTSPLFMPFRNRSALSLFNQTRRKVEWNGSVPSNSWNKHHLSHKNCLNMTSCHLNCIWLEEKKVKNESIW